MIDVKNIKLNEPIYYIPQYGGSAKVAVLKISDDTAIVLQKTKKKNNKFKPFPIHVKFLFEKPEYANRSMRDWEHWKRKNKR